MKSEVCCIKINSFDDFKYPLNELSKGWLFRGHERAEWALQTSVERILKKRNEQFCKICNCNMSDIDGKYHFLKLKDEYFAIGWSGGAYCLCFYGKTVSCKFRLSKPDLCRSFPNIWLIISGLNPIQYWGSYS